MTKKAAAKGKKKVVPRGRPMTPSSLRRKRRLILPPCRPPLLKRRFGLPMTDEMWEGVRRLHEQGRERSMAATIRKVIAAELVAQGIVEVAE